MTTLEQLIAQGWVISQKGLENCLKKIGPTPAEDITSVLLDTDLRELGTGWISSNRQQDQLDANGRIVQITRVRNVAVPQAEEDSLSAASNTSGPRLLRLALTDGTTNISALDIENCDKLSINTTPGTKLRLIGLIPINLGFLLLRKSHIQFLGGNVANLVKEWTVHKMFEGSGNRFSTGAPPFVPFGSREASDLIQSERRFLQSLNPDRNRTQSTFDSFKLATNSGTADKENEFDDSFNERRKDVIAKVKSDQNTDCVQSLKPANYRFQVGGSKFAYLHAEKMQAYDESLAHLISLGYPAPLAVSALKINKGDYKASVDYLLAKQVSNSTVNERGTHNTQSSRGRSRGRQNRGRAVIDLPEDDPRFDPAVAAAAAGLPSRPSTGLMRLDDLVSSGSSSRPSNVPGSTSVVRLPTGCPILAPNMFGDLEEARLIGSVGTLYTDKVALVVYTSKSADGSTREYEELVPVEMLRTINSEKITYDMLPVAPSKLSAAHNFVSSSNQECFSNFTNGPSHSTRDSYTRGGFHRAQPGRRPRGRSFTRMRRAPR